MSRGQSGPLGPRRERPTKVSDVADVPAPKKVERIDQAEALRAQLAELGIDPIAEMAKLLKDSSIRGEARARLATDLAQFLIPKQKPRDEELEALKRQTSEAARFVILGEREDPTAEEWEARNAGRVPIAPLVVEESLPEWVVPS